VVWLIAATSFTGDTELGFVVAPCCSVTRHCALSLYYLVCSKLTALTDNLTAVTGAHTCHRHSSITKLNGGLNTCSDACIRLLLRVLFFSVVIQ